MRIFERLTKGEQFFLSGFCCVLVCTVSIGIIARYAPVTIASGFTAPIEELSKLLFVWLVFWGASAAHREDRHYKMSVLPNLLGGRPRLVLHIVDSLVIAAFLFLMVMNVMGILKKDAGLFSIIMNWPVNLWNWAYLMGMAIMLIYTARRVILYVKEFLR